MSSDFLEGVIDDQGSVVLLDMRANGSATLTILEEDKETVPGSIANLRLIPDQTGWDNAKKVVNALNAWIQFTQGR